MDVDLTNECRRYIASKKKTLFKLMILSINNNRYIKI